MDTYFTSRKILGILFVFLLIALAIGVFWGSRGVLFHHPVKIGIVRYLKIYDPAVDGFKKHMAELGYEEGKNVVYQRFDADNVGDVNVAAQKLVQDNVNLIYAVTTVAASSTINATIRAKRTDIPIVFAQGNAPVRAGIVKSFESSGNNATGVAVDFVQTTSKKLEFLKMINPHIKKVGYFDAKFTDPAGMFTLEEFKNQASKFGLTLVRLPLASPPGPMGVEEIKKVLKNIKPGEIDAYFHLPGPLMGIQAQPAIQEALNLLKIPGVWLELPSVEKVGGLFAYSHDLSAMGEQAADIANKVLKGTKPTDIPVELPFPRKYILSVNLKTARDEGIVLPKSLLELADIKIDK